MTVRSILLFAPAETADARHGPAAYAIGLARQHGASLTIFSVALDVTTPDRRTDAPAAAAAIREAADSAGVHSSVVTEHSHAIGVCEVIAEHARVHDLSVTGSNGDGLLSERQIAEHLMFDSGRPVLVVPRAYADSPAHGSAAIAWDNSTAAARALGDAVALLSVEEAHFLAIGGDKPLRGDLDSGQLVALAERRGLHARHATVALGDRTIADALQQEARSRGAGLLVMGAFGHSRLRRFVLGSATAGVLEATRMPTLLSH